MDEFENKVIRNMFTSQYVASWIEAGGTNRHYLDKSRPEGQQIRTDFVDWLESLIIDGEHLTPEEIRAIDNFRGNGNLGLQEHAKKFLSSR